MTYNDFLNEIILQTKEDYGFFNQVQKDILDIVKELHNLFTTNDLNYYLAFGSLLGAARDKTFIPWDIDFDIFIKYQDIDKFNWILENKLSENFYFVGQNDNSFPYFQTRVCKKGVDHRIHVDVFYLYPITTKEAFDDGFKHQSEKLFYLRTKKGNDIRTITNNKKIDTIFRWKDKVSSFFKSFNSLSAINRKINKHLTHNFNVKCEFLAPFCDNFTPFKSSWFEGTVYLNVDNNKFCAPVGYRNILNTLYKDPNSYLPFKNRYEDYTKLLVLAKDAYKVSSIEKIDFRK